jgi:hypothetical protein
MDINKMLAELRQERDQIEEAIVVLERLARGRGKRRGRPPAWMSQLTGTGTKKKTAVKPGRRSREEKASATGA